MSYKSEIPPMNTLYTSPLNHDSDEPSGWQKFLWWLAAADPKIIIHAGADKFRFSVIGYTVMVTWLFATLAWGYFFSTVANDPLIYIPAAVFFGFVILSIDRALIAGINSKSKNKWLSVVFRLSLALTIGFFLSQPVVLMLFKKDIDGHLPLILSKQSAAFNTQLREANSVALNMAKADIDRIRNLQVSKEQEITDLKNAYIKETDGTGGSGKIGEYQIARVKKAEYLKAEDDYKVWKRNIQVELDSALALEKRTEQIIATKQADFQKQQSDGFLTRIETLDDLMVLHPPVKDRYRVILILILLIEIMPLITKLMMPSGLYEELLTAATEDEKLDLQMRKQYASAVEKEYFQIALESDRTFQRSVLEKIHAIRTEVAEKSLQEWKDQQGEVSGFWGVLKKKLLYFTK